MQDALRFERTAAGRMMMAAVTMGIGGYDRIVYRKVPIPEPGPGEVLVRVLAAAVNNTDINTRIGWYDSAMTGSPSSMVEGMGHAETQAAVAGWNGPTPFPIIQGTDCCGRIVALGEGGDAALLDPRVLVRPCMRRNGFASLDVTWMASDFDGAFAQFVKVPQAEVFPVECNWSDAELATIPCAYGTAENMLQRAGLREGETVLISGASGGVGSAAVQLAKRRGARVVAMVSGSKQAKVRDIGASQILDRGDAPDDVLGAESVDLVVDNVGGPGFAGLIKTLRRGGRYVSSGAIAGPVVALDLRDVYLKDITLFGSTAWDEPVFPSLIGYIERGEVRPLLAGTFPLERIAEAQAAFLEKRHVGKLVLIPPDEMPA